MPLVLKLVGYYVDNKHYEIKYPFSGFVNANLLHELFKVRGISEDNINQIKLITDSEFMTDLDKCYPVNEVESRNIFIFTSNTVLRQQLYDIFIKEVLTNSVPQTTEIQIQPELTKITPDPEICQPLTQTKPDTIPILTPEIINDINIKTISLFYDPDFKKLIDIYIRRPELFSTLAKYVQHGTVIEESLEPVKTLDMLSDSEIQHYIHLCEQIKFIGINLPDDVIITKLLKYSGHLNLTVRSLLCEST
jgi:hypothetical protein